MPRAGQTTGAPSTRLPQRVALGVLMRCFPPDQVDQILDSVGRREQRTRLLPARLMVYFTLGMWIFGALSYEEILAELLWDAPGAARPPQREPATAAAIGRARRRLGVEPLRLLFEQVAAAGAAASAAGATPPWWRVLRLTGIEAGVPDTPANRQAFAGAQARMSLLVDDATGRVVAAAPGPRPQFSGHMADALAGGTLLVVDDRPLDPRLWSAADALGCDQLWSAGGRVRTGARTRLPDGSHAARLAAAGEQSGRAVRVIARDTEQGADELVTSVLDHRAAPAQALLRVFGHGAATGGGGAGLGGIEAYRSGERLVLRSKDPDLVRQELYAMLCVHHAIGDLVGPR